ncbi:hypothetical protein A2333_00665 [Candidatus Wolfebacteria bacterium RIFOXYB2_FULL_49_7]|uniref:Addiction module toxin RelE n=2 Tax=Parcubacteria group TaxID=1794811 RepID=A0A1F8DYU7_9BACT|nr:MAG: hypothetical protein A2372_01820 [Candidatus Wolfebacteria bacterium RIFOXYB1_FULL_54_12]OGM94065.1 MAG: hypothetical protein A2333_00665 [Candidatus Wolfebacteria bacterium RIFOXYB2_FULL_49_7]OGZ89816.1 MAG: hypothetical protein A2561_03880 [Candidatus Staskawiczbacteria bacterium RIFOXYD1_FULL_32_13]
MQYRIILPKSVQKDLEKLDKKIRMRVIITLQELSKDPFAGKKLQGEHAGQWSVRAWPYRVIYRINKGELVVLVIRIAHRQGAY